MHYESREVPLYVLKYDPRKVFLLIFLFFTPALYMAFESLEGITQMFATGERNASLHILGIAIIICMFLLTDILLTREIRFYRNYIIKIWYILGSKKVELKEASMCISSISKWSRRTIFPKNSSYGIIKTISWEEILISDKDKEDLYKILAVLCNRTIDDLNKQGTIIDLVNPVESNR